jgi:tetratricopeptide (TPR) repeat protein
MGPRLVLRAVLGFAWLIALPLGVATAQQRTPPDIPAAEEAMRAAERFPPGDVRRSGPMFRLASAYWRAGRRDQAVALMRQVVDLRTRANGPQSPDLVPPLNDLGLWLRELGRPAEAGPVLQRGLQIADHTPAMAQTPLLGNLLSNLANIRLNEGKPDEARRLFERAVAVRSAAAQAAAARSTASSSRTSCGASRSTTMRSSARPRR